MLRSDLLAALGRFNAAHPWSHNDAFAGFVLRQARAVRRRGGTTAIDVGCGTGNLLERLAAVMPSVVGIEPDPHAAAIATSRFRRQANVEIRQQSWREQPAQSCDLIVFVASLHHMPLRSTLHEARAALRPGGRLVIVGVAADDSPDDDDLTGKLLSSISLVMNPAIGMIRHPRHAVGPPAHMRAPTAEPTDPFRTIRTIANEVLPGIRMRRALFWRYTASWTAPAR